MIPNRNILRMLSLAAAGALLLPVTASATVILADNFTGTPGSAVNGTTIQTWDSGTYGSAPTWVASTTAVYNGAGDSIVSNVTGGFQLVAATPNQTSGNLTLEATVSLVSGPIDWIGISFLQNTSGGFFNTNNTLMMILNPTGYVTLFKNAAGT